MTFSSSSFTHVSDPVSVGYYSEIDIVKCANRAYGEAFAGWLGKCRKSADFILRLASETSVVLLTGMGYGKPSWSVRASLANFHEPDYDKMGVAIGRLLDEYHGEYRASLASLA